MRLLMTLLAFVSLTGCAELANLAPGPYVGEWKDGAYHGQGTYTFSNGDQYVGEFRDNKMHGHGTYTHADGAA